MKRFDINNPFTLQDAQELEDKNCAVTCHDSGRTATYRGIVKPLDKKTTFVGDEIILNECVALVKINQTQTSPKIENLVG